MLQLTLQYFGHYDAKNQLIEKTLMLGKIESKSQRGQQRIRWLDSSLTQCTWIWANSKMVKDGVAWRAAVRGVTESDTT